MEKQPRKRASRFVPFVILGVALGVVGAPAHSEPKTDLHYAPNHNFGARGQYTPGKSGFNLADVNDARKLKSLPNGVKALVWVGQCKGADPTFIKTVEPFIGNPKVFGFYLMDEPDPTGRYKSLCAPDNLKAESDWIHVHVAGAKTFIVLLNLSSSKSASFVDSYNPANSHVDLFGIDAYPCRTEIDECDYAMIDDHVAAAKAWGIPQSDIVPVYQAFGGGDWKDDGGGKYALPSPEELQQMLKRWSSLVPAPVFDFAYSWGSQNSDKAIEASPGLQAVFARHNRASTP